VLGASNYTYAEPTLSQELTPFLAAHVRMFEFLGGCPKPALDDWQEAGRLTACPASSRPHNARFFLLRGFIFRFQNVRIKSVWK